MMLLFAVVIVKGEFKLAIDYLTVPVNKQDKAYLQQIAREKGKSLTDVSRIEIQAYIFALKTKKRHAAKEKVIKSE